jgi:hypothetical protein
MCRPGRPPRPSIQRRDFAAARSPCGSPQAGLRNAGSVRAGPARVLDPLLAQSSAAVCFCTPPDARRGYNNLCCLGLGVDICDLFDELAAEWCQVAIPPAACTMHVPRCGGMFWTCIVRTGPNVASDSQQGAGVLETLVTTATGAISATIGVLVGAIVTHRAQDRRWLRDKQLIAYEELLSHYAKFTMEISRAHAGQQGWDYDWGEWSAVLTRASLVAPADVATEIDNFGKAIGSFLDRVARGIDPSRDPLSVEEFAQANRAPAQAQVRLVNAIRLSLSRNQKPLSFWIGGSLADSTDDR